RNVTAPLLTPTLFFSVITGIIGSFQVFTQAFVMTGGGPNNATQFYMLNLYNQGFRSLKMGYASALAWILFAIIMVFTLVQLKTAQKWVYYEGGEG
ncbi:MAG TPA: sugar ABC transporter permease, partial [Fimbriimonadaceae bacterium]|nr:sugar ABC transporter permease [Fimbriimonadaceae bacterium]